MNIFKALSLCILPVCFPEELWNLAGMGECPLLLPGHQLGQWVTMLLLLFQLCDPGPRNEVSILIMLAGL